MKKLLSYINALSPAERMAFERAVGTSIGYLRKAVSQGQRVGAEICTQIELASSGNVTRKDMRPDDWARTWPELAEKDAA